VRILCFVRKSSVNYLIPQTKDRFVSLVIHSGIERNNNKTTTEQKQKNKALKYRRDDENI
jgi:hypothetical protein